MHSTNRLSEESALDVSKKRGTQLNQENKSAWWPWIKGSSITIGIATVVYSAIRYFNYTTYTVSNSQSQANECDVSASLFTCEEIVGSYQYEASLEFKPKNSAVSDGYLYVTGQYDKSPFNNELHIFDISSSSNPQLLQFYDIPAQDVDVVGKYVHVTTGDDRSQGEYIIYDNSILPTLTEIGKSTLTEIGKSANASELPDCISVQGNYAYFVAQINSVFVVFDITIPSDQRDVGFIQFYEFDLTEGALVCKDITLSGNYAYLAVRNDGLFIIDISSPRHPILVGHYTYTHDFGSGAAFGVAVSGKYAYLATGNEGLHIVDMSVPSDPTLIKVYESESSYDQSIYDVYINNHYALVASIYLKIYDISQGDQPILVGVVDSIINPKKISMNNHYAYILGYRDIYVVDTCCVRKNYAGQSLRVGIYTTLSVGIGLGLSAVAFRAYQKRRKNTPESDEGLMSKIISSPIGRWIKRNRDQESRIISRSGSAAPLRINTTSRLGTPNRRNNPIHGDTVRNNRAASSKQRQQAGSTTTENSHKLSHQEVSKLLQLLSLWEEHIAAYKDKHNNSLSRIGGLDLELAKLTKDVAIKKSFAGGEKFTKLSCELSEVVLGQQSMLLQLTDELEQQRSTLTNISSKQSRDSEEVLALTKKQIELQELQEEFSIDFTAALEKEHQFMLSALAVQKERLTLIKQRKSSSPNTILGEIETSIRYLQKQIQRIAINQQEFLLKPYEDQLTILNEQKTIKQNPSLNLFYSVVQLKLTEIFIGCKAASTDFVRKNVTQINGDAFEKAIDYTVKISDLVVGIPGISLIGKLFSAGAS